jgi:hypothetical protein
MKHPIGRVVAAALGGVAAVMALTALVIAVSVAGSKPIGPGWVVPLVVGGTVGLLSWLLLSTAPALPDSSDKKAAALCPKCGSEVFEDWRICPYCGGTKAPAGAEAE